MSNPVVLLEEENAGIPADPTLALLASPAAVLDLELRVVCANSAFVSLCDHPRAGDALSALLRPAAHLPTAPAEGAEAEYWGRSADGRTVALRLRRQGMRIGAVVRGPVDSGEPLAELRRTLVTQEPEQEALLSLSREVALAASEDELVGAIARCVRRLFPSRCFCVRTVDPRNGALTSLYAEGRLGEGVREKIALRRSAAEKAHLDARALPQHVQLTDEEPLVFTGTSHGFATPFAASGQFFGLLNLEYPVALAVDETRDEKLLIQLANQAAVGIRNVKLIEELTFVRKYLEELIENANALILIANRRRDVIVFNRALVTLSDVGREHVVGHALESLFPESERDAVTRVFDMSLRGERVSHFETLLRSATGDRRVVFNTGPVLNQVGEIEGVIAIGQDLSRQKELERRVMQAEKLATLGQLAAGVAHEINNPLSTITLFADSLLQNSHVRRSDLVEIDKLKRIKESADRILKFARDLTSYAKPSPNHTEEIDLHELIDQATRFCDHALKQSGAILTRRYGEPPKIHGVRANLVQVFVNLLTNSCHALPSGWGRIELTTRSLDGGVEIEVHDNGAGIPAEDLPRIFEPFFTTKPEGYGTGLGLTIVQGIVEKHGGTIRVASVLGEGTTFTLWLPSSLDPIGQ